MKELTHKLRKESVGADASVRPCFEGIHKGNKGITLIALIITIVVMMILVGVTITFTIGENGILSQTKEAKFKQEVSQLIEAVNMEKAAIIAENKGNTENLTFSPSDLTVNIPDDLKTKYIDNDKLCVLEDGNVYYNADKVTEEEVTWLEDLLIEPNSGSLTFKDKVKQIVKSDSTQKAEGLVNFDDIVSQLRGKDEVEFLVYKHNLLKIYTPANSDSYEEDFNKKAACEEILGKINEKNLTDDMAVEKNSDNEIIREIYQVALENELITEQTNYIVKNVKEIIDEYFAQADVSLCIASKEGNLLIDDKGNVYDNDIVIMSETEAEAMFALEEYDVEDGIAYLSINEYKGTEKNVKIPDVIYDENGNITKMITKINSFIPSVTPLYEVIYIDSDTYNEYNPIQIWNCVTDNKLPYPGDAEKDAIIKGKENNKAKYDKMVEHGLLGIVGLTEEDIILDNDYIPYLYIGEKAPIPIPEHTKIEKITISSNIIEIGTKAFLGQTALTEIKYKTPFGRPTIAEDAFDGCTSLTSIRFVGDDKWPFYYDHAGEGNPLPIEGYQTYWGAPNENVKIYDVDGTEVEI